MKKGTALKIGGVLVGAALLFVAVRILLGWLFKLVAMVGVALLVVALAYLAYRVWIAPDGSEEPAGSDATRDVAANSNEDLDLDGGIADPDGDDSIPDPDVDGSIADAEIERELEELREDS